MHPWWAVWLGTPRRDLQPYMTSPMRIDVTGLRQDPARDMSASGKKRTQSHAGFHQERKAGVPDVDSNVLLPHSPPVSCCQAGGGAAVGGGTDTSQGGRGGGGGARPARVLHRKKKHGEFWVNRIRGFSSNGGPGGRRQGSETACVGGVLIEAHLALCATQSAERPWPLCRMANACQ